MAHRALEVLQAIHAALPGSLLAPAYRPDATATVISPGQMTELNSPTGPDTFSVANWRLAVIADIYVYELETNWLDALYSHLAASQRAVMDQTTYAALSWVIGPWLGEVTPPDIDANTERSYALTRAEYYVDFRTDPIDPEV